MLPPEKQVCRLLGCGPMGISSVSQQEDRRPLILVPLMGRECLAQVLLNRLHVALHHGFGLCVCRDVDLVLLSPVFLEPPALT